MTPNTQTLLGYIAANDAFKDKIIMVTGAADGIGRAVARALATKGAELILLDRKQRHLETLYDEIIAAGGVKPALIVEDLADLTLEHSLELANGIGIELPHIDGLLHNAAELKGLYPLAMHNPEHWQRILNANLNAAYYLTRALLPLLKLSDHASVVFSSANAAAEPRAYWGAYAIAYAGIEAMCKIWADELETNTDIRFNVLDPGAVNTSMRKLTYPGDSPDRVAQPEYVVPAYLYLLGDDSTNIRGQRFSL